MYTFNMKHRHRKWKVRHSDKAGDIIKGRGPWGVYGEAMGNPMFSIGSYPNDSSFLLAAELFMAAHEDLLNELAKS
jgi:hypothetical protein